MQGSAGVYTAHAAPVSGAPGELVVGCAGPAGAEARAVATLAAVAKGGLRASAAARLAIAVHPHIALQRHTDALMAHF